MTIGQQYSIHTERRGSSRFKGVDNEVIRNNQGSVFKVAV